MVLTLRGDSRNFYMFLSLHPLSLAPLIDPRIKNVTKKASKCLYAIESKIGGWQSERKNSRDCTVVNNHCHFPETEINMKLLFSTGFKNWLTSLLIQTGVRGSGSGEAFSNQKSQQQFYHHIFNLCVHVWSVLWRLLFEALVASFSLSTPPTKKKRKKRVTHNICKGMGQWLFSCFVDQTKKEEKSEEKIKKGSSLVCKIKLGQQDSFEVLLNERQPWEVSWLTFVDNQNESQLYTCSFFST